ncbi:MAG: hypothetical protein H6Q15_2029 [Bacteroidetes bacterium]|nr:hypothetical protein [Bacteroidota bacterium]
MNNKSRLPLVISISIVFGILIGYYLLPKGNSSSISSNAQKNIVDKFAYLLGYINDDYVDKVDIDSLADKAIASFMEELDPHSVYLTAADNKKEQESLNGSFDGIGVQFRIIEDTVVVIQPVPSGPSQKAGVMAGDRIVTIDSKVWAGKKIKNEDVMRLLKGEKGTKVNLGIKRTGVSKLISFNITRDAIPTFSVDYFGMIDSKAGYIKLSQFSQTTADEVSRAIKMLKSKGMQELVFDLRGNGGGYLEQAYQVADEFIGEGDLIVYTQGRKRGRDNLFATKGGLFEKGKVIILIDELSASAAEILSGAIQDNDRGMIIGRRTFGKGLVQEQRQLPDGSAVRLTISRYHTPSGRCIQRPYITGDPEKYFEDFILRYASMNKGDKDTISHSNSQKYKTKKGRIVYGGGGIEPDVDLPYYNYKKGNYYSELIKKGLLYKFCFDYVDKHRSDFKIYFSGESFVKDYSVSQKTLNDLFAYAEKNGVKKDNSLKEDLSEIKLLMKAYFAQSLYEDKYFYEIYLKIDEDLQKAIPYFSKIK